MGLPVVIKGIAIEITVLYTHNIIGVSKNPFHVNQDLWKEIKTIDEGTHSQTFLF